jgi:glycosyltransferase involved in cell wall biosynthesis
LLRKGETVGLENGPRKLRVLHVILNLGETNGQYNEHCLPMMHKRDLSICTYFAPQLIPPEEIRLFAGDGHLMGFFRTLRSALKASRYDVLHVHAPQTGALTLLLLFVSLAYPRMRSSMVYTVQDSFYDYRLRNQAMMVVALAGYRRIIFCSRAAYDSVPRLWRWLARGRWSVVQNAADIERVDQALASLPEPPDNAPFTVLSIGRLEPVKDQATLIRAFLRDADKDARLVFVGDGSLKSQIVDLCQDLGLDSRVELTGLIPRDEVFARCAHADVMVSTSLGEGLPVAVIEAMAARCPVILSDIPPHRELADGDDLIPLVPIGDVEGFADQISRFRRLSPAKLQEVRDRSRAHVLARYTLPIMHAGTEAAYRQLPSIAKSSSTIV